MELEALGNLDIGPYDIKERLGGSFGLTQIFKVVDTRSCETFAMKFFTAPQADETARKRFVREALLASQLQHENICTE